MYYNVSFIKGAIFCKDLEFKKFLKTGLIFGLLNICFFCYKVAYLFNVAFQFQFIWKANELDSMQKYESTVWCSFCKAGCIFWSSFSNNLEFCKECANKIDQTYINYLQSCIGIQCRITSYKL